jgi:hypothetical protein
MINFIKQSCAALIIATLLVATLESSALSQNDPVYGPTKAEKMFFDIVLVRPIGIVGTAVGSVLFVVSLPFSAMAGNVGEAYQTLIVGPAAFTFVRPLGAF